jgi:hypothetical protein
MALAARALRVFGRFWWDFLVGDTPELLVAVLAVVGVAFALHPYRLVAVLLLPLLVIVVLCVSVWRGRAPRSGDGRPTSS